MTFEKNVIFLGSQAQKLADGSVYHQVQFYDKDSGPINVNVGGNNKDLLDEIAALTFGDPVVVTFALRPKDRAYRLVIDHVS